ncbi:MAG: TraR/DksA C4-type zinc finger protein [Deltaproteobacteria bacterium]|nr:TraR/DksA C4-type zinc finger protein [Deltaproteobacteria bacterium]
MTDEWWLEDDGDVADPLTEDEFQELHLDLIVLHDELEERLRAPTDATETGELGQLTRTDAMQQKRTADTERARMRVRLSKVVAALRLVVEEEYGECRRCGEAVGYARLKPTPETLLCLACAESGEKKR